MLNLIKHIKELPGVKEIYPAGPLTVVVVFNPEKIVEIPEIKFKP